MLKTWWKRMTAPGIAPMDNIERYGYDGEEAIYRILSEHFHTVIRNPIVPHNGVFLEKDFLVMEKGVPVVLEVKFWKGRILADGEYYLQLKEGEEPKRHKNPTGTTAQFVREWKKYYGFEGDVPGIVVFSEPDCVLDAFDEEGIRVVKENKMLSAIREEVKCVSEKDVINPDNVLRCTRAYDKFGNAFCKGFLSDRYIYGFDEEKQRVKIDTTSIRLLSVRHVPFTAHDKISVTFQNGETAVFRSDYQILTFALLDGSYEKLALNRIRHLIF